MERCKHFVIINASKCPLQSSRPRSSRLDPYIVDDGEFPLILEHPLLCVWNYNFRAVTYYSNLRQRQIWMSGRTLCTWQTANIGIYCPAIYPVKSGNLAILKRKSDHRLLNNDWLVLIHCASSPMLRILCEDLDYLIKVSGHFSVCRSRVGLMQMISSANMSFLDPIYISNQREA
jgi:hypothetical protein